MLARGRVMPTKATAASWRPGLLAVVLISVWAASVPGGAGDSVSPQVDPFPVLETADGSKAMVVRLQFVDRNNVVLTSTKVVFGRAHVRAGDPPLLRVQLMSDRDVLVGQFNAWHPMWAFQQKPDGTEQRIIRPNARGRLVFPFRPDLKRMNVIDVPQEQQVISVDLSGAILAFCQTNPADSECGTDLAVTKLAAPEPAVAGETILYTLNVTNNGPNPAQSAQMRDELPAGLTYQGGSPGCVEGPTRTVTCALGAVMAGETRSVAIQALVSADFVYGAGAPTAIVNEASVQVLAGTDTTPGNEVAQETTLIVAKADLAVDSLSPLAAPTQILLGTDYTVDVTTIVSSAGPSSPMDADVSHTAVTSPGATVSPASATTHAGALLEGEERSMTRSYIISCQHPGPHLYTFSSAIAPSRPDDTDPNPVNNQARASLEIDCVVPVAINIKPQSSPNPINLRLKGVVPLAVLTTRAGEYNEPLAFDATRIQPLSVRFGARGIVWSGLGGSAEAHGRGHAEDSYELDERTRDGDLDMVLHFALDQSGLQATDLKACLKGQFLGAAGRTFSFFGCDAILVTGP